MSEPEISVRPVSQGDRPMLAWLVAELWGSEVVAVHGVSLRPAELAGFIAERSGRLVGLLTYQLLGDDAMEIVTLNAIERRAGIGTLLIDAAVSKARRFGCREIRLTTTNDNVDALRFYQRRGFRLAELRPGAVDRARQHKPEIPRVGDYGIPLRDEIDLTLPVLPSCRVNGCGTLPGRTITVRHPLVSGTPLRDEIDPAGRQEGARPRRPWPGGRRSRPG